MKCSQCGAPNDSAAVGCAYCGAAIDRSVLPASIDALIEQKARAILLETRANDAARASLLALLVARAALLAREVRQEEARLASLAKERVALGDMQRRLDHANAQRPGLVHVSKGLTIFVAILAGVLGGIILPACVEPHTLWASVPMDTGIVFVALMLVVPLLAGRARRRGVARDRVAYAEALARLQASIAEKEASPGRQAR